MPDFLTAYTDGVWRRTREIVEEAKAIMPTLTYIRDGREFSIPMTYESFAKVGKDMEMTRFAARAMGGMGPEFAMLAMAVAERSSDLLCSVADKKHFMCEVGAVLHLISPQAFFVAAPVRFEAGKFTNEQAERMLRDPKPNAIIVTGRNLVRSYSLLTPFVSDGSGNLYYEKSIIIDSVEGVTAQGPFSKIYEPARN